MSNIRMKYKYDLWRRIVSNEMDFGDDFKSIDFFSLKINLKQSIMKFVLQWTVTGSGLPDRKWSDMISIVDFTILWMIQWAWLIELNYKELNERMPAAKVNLVNPKIDFFLCFNAKNLEVSRLIAQSSLSNKKNQNQSWIANVNHFWHSLNVFLVSVAQAQTVT